MAKFLDPISLKEEIRETFEGADNFLFIVSPFIKLDNKLKKILEEKKHDPEFSITLVYGKNEHNHDLSLGVSDLTFFKEFLNVEIYYHPDLHAKYYANEYQSIVTSLNLHSFSIKNNIEVGVLFERKGRFSLISDNKEDDASFHFFEKLIDHSECTYSKHLEQKKRFFGLFKGDYVQTIEVDETDITHKANKSNHKGYCIRTGIKISFNLQKPYSEKAFASWSQYKNKDYKEKYCHFSGELSHGETSFSKPILAKNWSKSKM